MDIGAAGCREPECTPRCPSRLTPKLSGPATYQPAPHDHNAPAWPGPLQREVRRRHTLTRSLASAITRFDDLDRDIPIECLNRKMPCRIPEDDPCGDRGLAEPISMELEPGESGLTVFDAARPIPLVAEPRIHGRLGAA